jgi:hypothetical protein
VTEVLQTRSVARTRPEHRITEPGVLRRSDGASVYTVAGSELFTSTRILQAERRLVAAAVRTDGHVVDAATVELALLESAANGTALDAGQAAVVRSMCTSRDGNSRLHQPAQARPRPCAPGPGHGAITPAKSSAWPRPPPQPRSSATPLGAPAETLAKLTWSIEHGDLPDWAERIGRSTLVIIDEAGMADTLSLDTAVDGDDQQLAAIGAGKSSATSKPATVRSG